ncbi:DUF4276 family protein [Actinomyces trachealis]|uniref:DUF4276 family protein n=1 Tax=Actinomyces trachealis TaxID=2763540 RepID=UPI0018929468|nr:DUF4276 family protein [Actinomyces trachealis]
MKQVIVLVEGQTEEELVKNVLAPAALSRDVHLVPSVVITSASSAATHRGGGSWKHYEKQLRNFLANRHLSKVGLLLDYYAYPKDAPGQGLSGGGPGRQRTLVAALRSQLPDPRFRPLVVLHEIEALVLAAIDAGRGDDLFESLPLARLREQISQAGGPEQVDGGPLTAPSKRLETADPHYLKTVTGPLLVAEAGLQAVLARCPTFRTWWQDLLA